MRGDAARARGDWAAAAREYGRHCARRPRDAAIAVQWGHALKQSQQFDAALAAYRHALLHRPEDADLLLSIGHLHKLRGDRERAFDFYRQSAARDGNRHAMLEIDALQQAGVAYEETSDEATLVGFFQAHMHALHVEAVKGISLIDHPGGRIETRSGAARVIASPAHGTARSARLGMLTIDVQPFDPAHRPRGIVMLDYGAGFDERFAIVFTVTSDPVLVPIVRPDLLVAIAWTPDRKANVLHPPTIVFHAEATLDAPSGTETIAAEDAARASWEMMPPDPHIGSDYRSWSARFELPAFEDREAIMHMIEEMSYRPTFSFVMPTYNTPIPLLRACIDSMLAQSYPDFEICIADDASPNTEVMATLEAYSAGDPRVRIIRRSTNGHISEASNSALELARGAFVVLVDHDDLLPDYALAVVASYLNRYPDADILYSDEDKIDRHGLRSAPYFKGRWNRFLMYGHNMVSHLGVYRRTLVEAVGGFRVGFEGSQDYDLLLRCYERSSDDRVIHIPHVLYHWRMIPGSTSVSADQKDYACLAAQRALNEHFARCALPMRSVPGFAAGLTGVTPHAVPPANVTIVIPTRNGLASLRRCIDAIQATEREATNIVVVDNDSDDPATLSYLETLVAKGVASVVRDPLPFNFSRVCNIGAAAARGDILCFLNNDTEVLAADWIVRARMLLALPDVGIVGARLLYPDRTLQHFGIVLGMGAHGIAGTPHGGIAEDAPGYFGKARLMQEFSAVTAACLFIRKTDFEAVGGFDTEFAIAYNDVDLCLRIAARGLKIVGDPGILLLHAESTTRGDDVMGAKAARLAQDAEQMRERWGNQLNNDPYYSPNLTLERSDFSLAVPPRVAFPWQAATH
ncbi:GT2 family glycosyltransferase [Sphingomonas trueperi]|uniref:glycosyltransferase family 2 protein n=1 Tax=Sphingomonas trueperi TaxID=53317 RepID=UPI003393E18A